MVLRSDVLAMTRQILLRHHLFASFTSSELDQVLARARVVTYKAREDIFRKGSAGLGLLAVLKGTVRISSVGPDGDQVVLNQIGEGDVFGEIALLDGKERTADATAMTNCELLQIDRRDFLPFLRANPDIALRLLALLCDRLRRTTEQVEDMIFLDAEARLAKKLLSLGEARPRRKLPSERMSVTISQRELGIMIGLSRESINKQLSAWQSEGVIKVENGAIVVLDEAALRAYVEPVEP
jgi:CRP-like cAMP-binding protein